MTIEVTPRIAEKIAVAQSLGSLSLSLRSIADNTSELEREVAAGDIKVPAGANPAQEKQMLLAMANRPIDSNTTFSTGGDVSRFQRRTVPAQSDAGDSWRRRWPVSARSWSGACRPAALPVRPVRSSGSLAAMMSPLFRWELAKMNTATSPAGLASAPRSLRWPLACRWPAAPAVAQPTGLSRRTYRPSAQVRCRSAKAR